MQQQTAKEGDWIAKEAGLAQELEATRAQIKLLQNRAEDEKQRHAAAESEWVAREADLAKETSARRAQGREKDQQSKLQDGPAQEKAQEKVLEVLQQLQADVKSMQRYAQVQKAIAALVHKLSQHEPSKAKAPKSNHKQLAEQQLSERRAQRAEGHPEAHWSGDLTRAPI